MLGGHLIKTWSASQGAFALSSAEAELYGMVEAVTRAKGLFTLAWEIGFRGLSNIVHLGTDSSAAKSFISRMGPREDEAFGDSGPFGSKRKWHRAK